MADRPRITVSSFRFIEPIGRGSYGDVMRAEFKESGVVYAVKIVSKAKLQRENKTRFAHIERNMLTRLKHPGIVRLHYTFQDQKNLYYATDLCAGGELLTYINCYAGHFSLELARFYTAEIINILEYLHANSIAHRDLKPENLLLTTQGHLKLIDFGTALDCNERHEGSREASLTTRSTFVGTAEYVSPEVLNDEEAGTAVDLWALGCIVYQLIVGRPPFKAANEYLIFDRIRTASVEYPPHMPAEAVELIRQLLRTEPSQRLGAGQPGTPNDFAALKSHAFLEGLDVNTVFGQSVPSFAMIDRVMNEDLEVKLLNSQAVGTDSQTIEVIYAGFVDKKAGWIFRKRKLMISSLPQISYWHPTKPNKLGEIVLSSDVVASVTGDSKFTITRPGRTYYFKTLNGEPPDEWVEIVNKVVEKYFPRYTNGLPVHSLPRLSLQVLPLT
jgi:serine/threonine protein kinase